MMVNQFNTLIWTLNGFVWLSNGFFFQLADYLNVGHNVFFLAVYSGESGSSQLDTVIEYLLNV